MAPDLRLRKNPKMGVRLPILTNRAWAAGFFGGRIMGKFRGVNYVTGMQFEEQNAAVRQMKELLRDQAKFRAKLDRVVRKIETSSERTAKLAERNKTRKSAHETGNGNGNGNGHVDGNGAAPAAKPKRKSAEEHARPSASSNKLHGDKLNGHTAPHAGSGDTEEFRRADFDGEDDNHEDGKELAEVGKGSDHAISDPAAW